MAPTRAKADSRAARAAEKANRATDRVMRTANPSEAAGGAIAGRVCGLEDVQFVQRGSTRYDCRRLAPGRPAKRASPTKVIASTARGVKRRRNTPRTATATNA
jgi:hypothetical protein